MAASLNAGFENNINNITVRASATKSHVYTDRNIDFDGDGVKEKRSSVGIPGSGNHITYVLTVPTGAAKTIVDESFETDGGVDKTGLTYTEGI